MGKLKLGIIFGGMSTEHDVSVISGKSVLNNLNKNKYEIFAIYIDTNGQWYQQTNEENKILITNIISYLQKLDVVFPVLHGKFGEDGTIQGLLELLKIPYVGCGILASSISMDKAYTKLLFAKTDIKQAKYVFIKKVDDNYIYIDDNFNEAKDTLENISKIVEKNITYPMFIKPSNSGSSVGINKAKDFEQLKKYINYASQFDNKILIEETIIGKEIECAVIGNKDIKASSLGEIRPSEEFYSFDAKYNNETSELIIPANINQMLTDEVRKLAVKAFKTIDGKGLARVDFFVNDKTNEIYINEINTLPGFTSISMYPKLWEYEGMGFSELLDKLIELALEK